MRPPARAALPAWWRPTIRVGKLRCIEQSLQPHLEAARRHEEAAANHERAAIFWEQHGDSARAGLQREFAEYERGGAELERRWAALIERDAGGPA